MEQKHFSSSELRQQIEETRTELGIKLERAINQGMEEAKSLESTISSYASYIDPRQITKTITDHALPVFAGALAAGFMAARALGRSSCGVSASIVDEVQNSMREILSAKPDRDYP